MSCVKAHAKHLLTRFQFGMATKAEADTIVHEVRERVDTLGRNN